MWNWFSVTIRRGMNETNEICHSPMEGVPRARRIPDKTQKITDLSIIVVKLL